MARGPGAQTGYFAAGGASGDGVSLPGLVGGSVFLPVRGYERDPARRTGRPRTRPQVRPCHAVTHRRQAAVY